MSTNRIRKNIRNVQRKTFIKRTISNTKQVSNILRSQIAEKTAAHQSATHTTKKDIKASIYHQFAIQPLNTSKNLSNDEVIKYQVLKHFFTLKNDNGEYKGIPTELILETKDDIENAYKKQNSNKELPNVKYSSTVYPATFAYNDNDFAIIYMSTNETSFKNDFKIVMSYIKDEKLKSNVNKVLSSSSDEQKALFYNCYAYYTLAHEYKHFDQFSLIANVFGAEAINGLKILKTYLNTKQKLSNFFFAKFEDEIEKIYTNLFPQKSNNITKEEKMHKLERKVKELDEEYKFLFTTENIKQNDFNAISTVETKQMDKLDDFEEIFFNFEKKDFNKNLISDLKNDNKHVKAYKEKFLLNMKFLFNCPISPSQIKQKLKNAGKNEDDFKTYLTLKMLSTVYNNIILSSSLEDYNNFEKKEELYEKLDKVEDNNERLIIIKNAIKNGTISLSDDEKKAIVSYQKNCNETNSKEITDEEKTMAQKYVDTAIGYSYEPSIYYNNPLEQEAYGYQIQKALELFKKIKQSDLGYKNVESFKNDIQKKIAEKEERIEKEKNKNKLNIVDSKNLIKRLKT